MSAEKTPKGRSSKKCLSSCAKAIPSSAKASSGLPGTPKDLLTLVEKLKEKEVGLISHKESFDTNTPPGKFMRPCLAHWRNLSGISAPTPGRRHSHC
ncbi:MAG: recombinase family protein [Dethiobacter sp.]